MRASHHLRPCLCAYLLALSVAAVSQNAYTTHSVSVYAGPDDSYPLVAELDADAPVDVMGCLDDWSWCDVTFEDNRGWVYAPDVIYDYQGGDVPLYAYGPGLGIPVVGFTIGGYWDRYYRERPWYAQRDEWIHREPPRHHRPQGPPPSAAPPPLSARVERPSHDGQPLREGEGEHPLRLGSTEPSHREPERREPDGTPAKPTGAEHTGAERAGSQREAPSGHVEAPRQQERSGTEGRSSGEERPDRPDVAHHEGKPNRPTERPNDAPR
jgi:uncharacterized protein YraI